MTSTWCILQMASSRTLAVVRSLRRAGFDVWAPTGMRRRKRPRSSKYRDEAASLLPALAFAPYEDAPRLSAMLQEPVQDHPRFSLLMHRGTYGKVSDAALEPLREFEATAGDEWQKFVDTEERARLERIRKNKGRKRSTGRANPARSYVLGQTVQVAASGFQGLTGKILENRRNGELVVVFDGLSMELTVEACDLRPVHVEHA